MTKIYSKADCVQCTATKKFVERNNIPHEVLNIDENPEYAAEAQAYGYLQAPVVVTEGDHWSGFRPDKLSLLV